MKVVSWSLGLGERLSENFLRNSEILKIDNNYLNLVW